MTRVVALANPQARSGKTSAAVGLASAFADLGLAVLVVDLDPQAALSRALGVDADAVEASLAEVLVDGRPIDTVMTDSDEGVDVVPAALELSGIETQLMTRAGREQLLAATLAPVAGDYEWVVIDCASSLGLLTTMALAMAHMLVIPERTPATRAVGRLLDSADEIRRLVNPRLRAPLLLPIGGSMAGAAHGDDRVAVLPAVPAPPQDLLAYAALAHRLHEG